MATSDTADWNAGFDPRCPIARRVDRQRIRDYSPVDTSLWQAGPLRVRRILLLYWEVSSSPSPCHYRDPCRSWNYAKKNVPIWGPLGDPSARVFEVFLIAS